MAQWAPGAPWAHGAHCAQAGTKTMYQKSHVFKNPVYGHGSDVFFWAQEAQIFENHLYMDMQIPSFVQLFDSVGK